MASDIKKVQNKLWEAANKLRANSSLKGTEFSIPVLGLIFLRYADFKFEQIEQKLEEKASGSRRRGVSKTDYLAEGLYIPTEARYSYLMNLPEGTNIGSAINKAMDLIEAENESVAGILPKGYTRLENELLFALLKLFNEVKFAKIQGDAFGMIYEYFLGKFASSEGQKGGEFFTPTSIVKLMVEILSPFKGLVLDPACGSGGMFVQSSNFVKSHNPENIISIYGQEKTLETVKLCKMNLAVHGLSGDIRQANTFYENVHSCINRFDFVLANPPFNVSGVDKTRIVDDKRYCFGIPKADNANYLWIQEFYSALREGQGRAGFVMANSASDARQTEQDIRAEIIKSGAVDVMVSVGSNFFHNVTLPCTLWFFDKGKPEERKNKTLFLDVREIYRQIDRAHRDFTDEDIEFITNIVKLYRGEKDQLEFDKGSEERLEKLFPNFEYQDIAGLCKEATTEDIEKQGWSLNPGRYVGVAKEEENEDFDFVKTLKGFNEELAALNEEAHRLESSISSNISELLEVMQ